MRSRASIKGHPIHPALIPFPFAFLTGAFLFDLAGRLTDRPAWWTTGAHLALAGIAAALLAALPGFIDYVKTVPPDSTAKQRATKHMAANLSAVALFAAAWWLRGDAASAPDAAILGLEGIGVVLLTAGGWMGGTLVNRNQIGVDHRYAGAGKWRETSIAPRAAGPVPVARVDELAVNQMKLVRIDGRRLVLARTEQGYVAFDDRCTHRGGSLAGGTMICGTVQCPWHGSQFDVRTGAVKAGPAEQPIGTYRADVRGNEVAVILDDAQVRVASSGP
jgi:uncharacterized membrane protein/nitrite reductase/ring-hydroxylating ferredoxin subunit